MKLIVAGSRSACYRVVHMAVHNWVEAHGEPSAVLCGGARGADTYGQLIAANRDWPVEMYPADWDKYGKRAGYLRNLEMGLNADALLAVWDGESKGTKMMIDIAKQQDIDVTVVTYGR